MFIIDNLDKPFLWIWHILSNHPKTAIFSVGVCLILLIIQRTVLRFRYWYHKEDINAYFISMYEVSNFSRATNMAVKRLNEIIEAVNSDPYIYSRVTEEFDISYYREIINRCAEEANEIIRVFNKTRKTEKRMAEFSRKIEDLITQIKSWEEIWPIFEQIKEEAKEYHAREKGNGEYEERFRNRKTYQRAEAHTESYSFFGGCKSKAEVKALYRALAKEHHPDAGGDAEVFATMLAEYESVMALKTS